MSYHDSTAATKRLFEFRAANVPDLDDLLASLHDTPWKIFRILDPTLTEEKRDELIASAVEEVPEARQLLKLVAPSDVPQFVTEQASGEE